MYNILNILASNIKYYRIVRGYSQEKLAELSNISTRCISDIENKNTNPSIIILASIASALDIDITLLILDHPHYPIPSRVNIKQASE